MSRKQRQPPPTPLEKPVSPPSILAIFLTFFHVGATAYGGPAMMPAMRELVVVKRRFVGREEFRLGLGLCQTLPGGTLMQLAAYIGLKLRGLTGAMAAYFGFSAPAFLLIVALTAFYSRTQSLPLAVAVFSGLKVVVLAVCLMSCLDFVKRFAPSRRHQAFTAGAAALFLSGAGVVPIVVGAALGGIWLLDPGPAPEVHDGYAARRTLPLAAALAVFGLAALAYLYLTDRLLFTLAVSMIKVDMLAFGGFGVIPVMFAEVVTLNGWMDQHTFLDGMALAQITPGPTMLASAFVGYWVKGVAGAAVASIGIFFSSFVIVLAAAQYRNAIIASLPARRALSGVLATLGGMIVAVSVTLARAIDWGWPQGLLLVLALAALSKKMPVPLIVLAGAVLSAFLF